ncbi:hypothetical protein A2U01_0101745, partial [Trifolium medium]|nr:hypothetical protein [Trifolium medium]
VGGAARSICLFSCLSSGGGAARRVGRRGAQAFK